MQLLRGLLAGVFRGALKTIGYGLGGGLIVLVVVFVIYLDGRADLKVWHETVLDGEFTAKSPLQSFTDYLDLEQALFNQLDKRIYDRMAPIDRHAVNRYHRGSLSSPEHWPSNWNRTFELAVDSPRAGVLLLHGMSDSPYSLRNPGQRLREAGAWVIGLRLPGHGTVPSGLVEVRWQDMAAAVRLAIDHLRRQTAGQPLYIVGYSNGGALAVHYALMALEDAGLPAVDGLVLISPAIGVSSLAALAVWQARLGYLLGLDKLAWNSILPEYDPFKYGSFAINAGDQVYRLTAEIQSRLNALGEADILGRFPPVLAFQSAVDATVSTSALVEGLFERLPVGGHELVLFDLNRLADVEELLVQDPKPAIENMLKDPALPFTLTLLTNARGNGSGNGSDLVIHRKQPAQADIIQLATNLRWPPDVYSLSHVALPFPESDPLYGNRPGDSPGIELGNPGLHGERGVLRIPAADLLRLRWNPFYSYLERRALEFLRLAERSDAGSVRPSPPR